jgi:hypothetical protein
VLRRAVLLASVLALALPATATAATCTATGSDWNNPDHWSGCPAGQVPDGDDDVVIPSPFTVNVNTADQTANSVTLNTNATLSVWDGRDLVIDGGAASTFTGTVEVLDAGSILRLGGSTTWNAGNWGAGGERGGAATNDPGGRIENAGTLAIPSPVTASNPGGGRMVNLATGTVLSTADTNLVVAFENDGQVSVGAGTLSLPIGIDTSGGDYSISDAAATLALGGAHTLSLTGGITGPGTLRLNAGVITLAADAAFSPGVTAFAGGQLALGGNGTTGRLTSNGAGGGTSGAGTLAVGSGASNLNNVFFGGGGDTTFGSSATIDATGLVEVLDEGTVLRLDGTTTWSAGNWAVGGERFITNEPGGTVENDGTWNLTGATTASQTGSGAIANLAGGTLNRATAGTATLNPPLTNAGTINVTSGTLGATVTQTGGTTTVASTLGGGLALQGGVVTGTGSITGTLNNTGGVVRPGSSPGTLSVGAFTQGAGGTLEIELDGPAAGTGFDVLAVTGSAGLGGTVAVDRTFEPALGDAFTFLTAATLTGEFATLTGGGGLDGGRLLELDYPPSADSARLVVVDPPPPANTSPPTITGTPAVGQTLTCQPGTWTNSPTFAFQWLRDGAPIAGADDQTYALVPADGGHAITCRVTATNAGGSASANSNTVNVPPAIIDPAETPTPTPTPAPAPPAQPARRPPAATPQEIRLDRASANQVAAAFGLPSARRCVSRRNFTIRLRRPRGVTIAGAQVRVNNKRVRVRRVRGRFTARIDLRGFPRGRFTVRIRIRTESERTLEGRRRYRTCAPRRG